MEIKWFKEAVNNQLLVNKLKKIKLIISDVDGSLTDNLLYPHENTEETKGFSTQDGFAITQAIQLGLQIALLSGKNGKILQARADTLGIPKANQFWGVNNNKIEYVQKLQKNLNTTKEETLYFGDDTLDIEVKDAISLFVCPLNAIFYIKPLSDIIIPKTGGYGAFRMLLDLTLYVQKKHFKQSLIDNALNL